MIGLPHLKAVQQPVAIFTLNLETKIEEQQALNNAGFKHFKSMRGSYKGQKETSYLVPVEALEDLGPLLDLARTHGQESILFVEGVTREASLIFTDPETPQEHLGKLTPVDAREALKSESWTLDVEADQFFITK